MVDSNDMNTYLKRLRCGHGLRVRIIGIFALTAAVLFCVTLPAHGVDLADAPLFTKINPPPTNLMILLDDSGSMTYEILVRGEYDGKFPNPDRPDTEGFCYVFDNMNDGYNYTDAGRHMEEEGREYWRSQWYEVNAIYYNPNIVYNPWPDHAGKSFEPADIDEPLVHPLQDKTLDLDRESFTVDVDNDGDGTGDGNLRIAWSHYFVKSTNGTVYLVLLQNGAISYYTFMTDNGLEPNDKIEMVTRVPIADVPADIQRSYNEDRQNFATWFTYHRRREFVAKAAIARVIRDLDSVRVGILGINNRIVAPLKPVKALIDSEFKDESDALIETLYDYRSNGGTPLKTGLRKVGEYFRVNDGDLAGEEGDAPYPADGGDCQQSFTIVVTDGYYSDEGYNPTTVGNADGNTDYAEWGGGKQPYTDAYRVTLADIAMYYYANDLSPDEDDSPRGNGYLDQVPTNKWDSAPHQHMVTFAVAFGVSGTLDPDDYVDDRTSADYMKSKSNGDYVDWPEVTGDREPESIDDLWHATVNGRGVFVNAGNPEKLVEGLVRIVNDIKVRQPTSSASVTVNGDYLYGKIGANTLIFQGSYSYIDNEWSGDVRAYRIDQLTGSVIIDPVWSAAEKLQIRAWDSRKILTFNGNASGQMFDYAELTGDQKAKLGPEPKKVVVFIRGKDPDSNGNRSNMLGDIVHSSPVFGDGVVYVGANDGMLHAFSAIDGTEIFGYVPYLVFDHLQDLADADYDHRFYVDLTPTVQKGRNLLGGAGDEVILVGGLGKGGMGYFALDITKPLDMGPNKVLWEFPRQDTSAEDVADMGYSFSKPEVVRSYKAAPSWVVITGNGYNSPNGDAVLFILDAKTGKVIRKIATASGPDNGLSSPIAVDVDHDDVVDFVYAGDLKGNLWKFDLISNTVTNWRVAFKDGSGKAAPLFGARDPAGAFQPITTRPDVMFHPEKSGLMVCFGTGKFLGLNDLSDIQTQTIYGLWDYGDTVFQPGEGWSTDPNPDNEYLGVFVSRDEDARQLSNPYLSEDVQLLKQAAKDYAADSGAGPITVRILSEEQPVWDTVADSGPGTQLPDPIKDAGWYLDLDVYPGKGERVIGDVMLRDGILIAIGFIPEQSRCSSGGDSIFMELNAFTGGSIGSIQFDINDDGVINEKDLVEVEIDGEIVKVPPSGLKLTGQIQPPAIIKLDEKREKKYMSSSGGGIVEVTEKAARTGIAYWMELRE
jgi:type IV pilus assembly protein PilY1